MRVGLWIANQVFAEHLLPNPLGWRTAPVRENPACASRFPDIEFTPWGGVSLLKRMLDCPGSVRSRQPAAHPGSSREYPPARRILQFMFGVCGGANRITEPM